MSDGDVHRIELSAPTIKELRSFLDASDVDFGCRPVVRREGGEFVVEVYAPLVRINGLRAARGSAAVTIKIIENATQTGRARQAEVGAPSRLSGGQVPKGLGIKE
jgi:hypothetical protein